MRLRFPMPRFDTQKFQQIAGLNDIDWDEINMQMLLEDFRLRYHHLVNGDLTNEEKKTSCEAYPATRRIK